MLQVSCFALGLKNWWESINKSLNFLRRGSMQDGWSKSISSRWKGTGGRNSRERCSGNERREDVVGVARIAATITIIRIDWKILNGINYYSEFDDVDDTIDDHRFYFLWKTVTISSIFLDWNLKL